MSVPHGVLLDRHYNAAHADHIHVEPPTQMTGTPPFTNPGITDGVSVIYNALNEEFGQGAYFLDANGRYVGNDEDVGWTHMGGYNRRKIGDSNTWSQHSWWNALDIGPYVGVAQDKFVNFITGKEDNSMAFTDHEENELKRLVANLDAVNSNGGFVKYLIPDMRKNIVTMDELQEALEGITQGTVDATARKLAREGLDKLQRIKEAI